jgi:hypothetical protein
MPSAATDHGTPTPLLDPARITPLMVAEYKLWFINGTDFYLQNSYLLPADSEALAWARVAAPLTSTHIQRHLDGQHTIGVYALTPQSSCGKWFALDADYPGAEEHLEEIAREMREDGLSPALEDSRRGGHLWVLCSDPIPARLSRIYLYSLLDRLGLAIRGPRGNKEGIEIFPKQESLEAGQVGNGLRGPLGVHRKVMKRFWFRDAVPEIEAQFAYLRRIPRCSRRDIESLTNGMDMPVDLIPTRPSEFLGPAPQSQFDIRFFIEASRRHARTYHVQCPSCAEAGRDTGRDNLHITETSGRPPLYHCFAGCGGEDIRAACYRRAGTYSGRRLE